MACRYDFEIDAGAGWERRLTITDSNDDPVDLTGCTVEMQFRRVPGSEEVDIALTSDPADGITLTAEDGTIDFDITADHVDGMSGRYVYAIELHWPSGRTHRLLDGQVFINAETVREEGT